MVLTRTSETVPIVGGKMQLGTWQGIFLYLSTGVRPTDAEFGSRSLANDHAL
jgi:thiamine phosphate synthase YjbQ (UPF0047 family)